MAAAPSGGRAAVWNEGAHGLAVDWVLVAEWLQRMAEAADAVAQSWKRV